MEFLPAIDLRNGRSVRLLRGEYDAETVYGDPVTQATRYEKAGASILHVVDLDAARTGVAENATEIARIVASVRIPVEVGGGVRSFERARELFGLGVARVVLGTAAIEDPDFARSLAGAYPGQVVLGLDYRSTLVHGVTRRAVAVRGWEQDAGVDLLDVVARHADDPIAAVVATDIGHDGTLEGPDLDGYRALLAATEIPVIASGGVGTLDDLRALRDLAVGDQRVSGVIVGKALLEGAFDIEEAVAACRP
jgi:phosphoribosylformimino-5-aminoimidazole carboxamide ribotide isomerase